MTNPVQNQERESKINILLVEDEVLIALQKQMQLEEYGYIVNHVISGEEAIQYVFSPETEVDLILMDINLPDGMNGTVAAQRILEKMEIAIVFFSSHAEPEIVEQTENISSYGYILKSSPMVILDASIKMALKLFDAKMRLQKSESFRKKVFESSKTPSVILEAKTFTFIECNQAALDIFGLSTPCEMKDKHIEDFSLDIQFDGTSSKEKLTNILKLVMQDGDVQFEWCFQKNTGEALIAEVQMLKFRNENSDMLHFSIFDVTEKRKTAKAFQETQTRLHEQRATIAKLVSDPIVYGASIDDSLERITEYLSKTLKVQRCGIWVLSEDKNELKALKLYDAGDKSFSSGSVLSTSDFPKYFRVILAENRIISHDSYNDPITSELVDGYLKVLGITSMLDAGFFVNGALRGVICSEHIGPKRNWMPDEESFVSTIAAILGQIFAVREKQLT